MRAVSRRETRADCFPLFVLLAGLVSASLSLRLSAAAPEPNRVFRAGAYAIDISPQKFPVLVNAMFTERTADRG